MSDKKEPKDFSNVISRMMTNIEESKYDFSDPTEVFDPTDPSKQVVFEDLNLPERIRFMFIGLDNAFVARTFQAVLTKDARAQMGLGNEPIADDLVSIENVFDTFLQLDPALSARLEKKLLMQVMIAHQRGIQDPDQKDQQEPETGFKM